jgi:uncharacterized membrane protein
MLFGTPITWMFSEIISLILLFVCLVHAAKQKNSAHRIMEFLGFIIAAAVFENIGVWGGIYNYDLHRLLMIGKVPLCILIIEAAIVYAGFILVERLTIPKWTMPFAVGLFGAVQDMTIDPSSVFDLHEFNGKMAGQWNWAPHYDGGLFGIPFFNYSGWFTMIAFFVALVLIGRHLYEKKQNKIIGYAYPILAGIITPIILVSPVNQFLLFMSPIFPLYTKIPELIMMSILLGMAVCMIFIYRNKMKPFDFQKDKLCYVIPMFLHGFYAVLGYTTGIKQAYLPGVLITVIHLMFFFYLYMKAKKQPRPSK